MTAPAEFLDRLEAIVGATWLYTDRLAMLAYECDALAHTRETPLAVVLPATTDEVRAVVVACAEAGVPFVARGSGTSVEEVNRLNNVVTQFLDYARPSKTEAVSNGEIDINEVVRKTVQLIETDSAAANIDMIDNLVLW